MELEEFVYLVRYFQPTSYDMLQKQLWEAHDQQNVTKLEKCIRTRLLVSPVPSESDLLPECPTD